MTDFTERGLPERVARNREIARLREEDGLPWEAVAERLQISVRTASRGYADHLRSAAPESFAAIDVEEICLRVVRTHLLALDRLEPLASRRDNQNAAVGAARSLATVGASLLGVLGRVGLLPESGDRWRISLELQQIARELLEACDRHGVPSDVAEKVFGVATAAAEQLNPALSLNGSAEVPV